MNNESHFRYQITLNTIDRTLMYFATWKVDLSDDANIKIDKCIYEQLEHTLRHYKFLRYLNGGSIPLFENQFKNGWVEVLQNIPLNTREYPEELLPAEGETLYIMNKDGTMYDGYFIWSGEYKFLRFMGDGDTVEVENIVSWQYK